LFCLFFFENSDLNKQHKLITLTCADQRIFNGRKCVDPTGGHQCTPPAAAEDVLGEPHGLESVQYAIGVGAGSGKYSPAYDVVATPSDGGAAAAAAASAAGGGCEHSNGFFVVAGTACQSYYFCIGGVRSDQHCPRHQVFNGEVCVPAGQFHCADDGAGASASSNSKNQVKTASLPRSKIQKGHFKSMSERYALFISFI